MYSPFKLKLRVFSSLMAVAAILSACGGGNSSTTSAATSTLVTSVPTPTYAAGSVQLGIYEELNNLRSIVGSGLLAQNTILDTSAAAHLNYLNLNISTSLPTSSIEVVGNPGYTGTTPTVRAQNAGYATGGTVGELVDAFEGSASGSGCVAGWENSVYHMLILFSGVRDVGIAAGEVSLPNLGTTVVLNDCVVDNGTLVAFQNPASNVILVYPYSGQTGVTGSFNNQAESPAPAPDLSGVGHPIGVQVSAPISSINTFTLATADGTIVPTRILVSAQTSGSLTVVDSNLNSNNAFLVPISALASGTTYTVVFNAVVNGATVSNTWSFTTA